jgi:hypothetical protein
LNKFTIVFLVCLLPGCGTTSNGAIWAYADFNKYEKNYLGFPTQKLKIGSPKWEVTHALGTRYEVVEASQDIEVISYEKWKSVPGPDYVDKKLLLRFKDLYLTDWKIAQGTTTIVPIGW